MPMTPLQSWATMILLIVFAVALTHLVVRGDARLTAALAARKERRAARAEALERAVARHPAGTGLVPKGAALAPVTPLREAPSARAQEGRRAHLRLVEAPAEKPRRSVAPRLYDHEVDGI